MEDYFKNKMEEKNEEIRQEFFKSGVINEKGENNEKYYKQRRELKMLEMVNDNDHEEIIIKEDLPIFKTLEQIVKNHYGDNLTPIELTKDSYSIKELIDLGWLSKNGELTSVVFVRGEKVNDDTIINFEPSYYNYYEKINNDKSSKIIGVSNENYPLGSSIKELELYYNCTRFRFSEVIRGVIDINDISKEILDLIPKDFGEYKFDGVSPYSNSLYFTNKLGYKCRISDHRLGRFNKYTDCMVYNILINQSESTPEKEHDQNK